MHTWVFSKALVQSFLCAESFQWRQLSPQQPLIPTCLLGGLVMFPANLSERLLMKGTMLPITLFFLDGNKRKLYKDLRCSDLWSIHTIYGRFILRPWKAKSPTGLLLQYSRDPHLGNYVFWSIHLAWSLEEGQDCFSCSGVNPLTLKGWRWTLLSLVYSWFQREVMVLAGSW